MERRLQSDSDCSDTGNETCTSERTGKASMTRYFFHIDNGGVVHPDVEGADFASVTAMRNEAICSLEDVVRHGTLEHDRRSSVQVRDVEGTLIFSATMRVLVETSGS